MERPSSSDELPPPGRWRIGRKGPTLVELGVILISVGLLSMILFPVFVHLPHGSHQSIGSSNMKRIALALLEYCQDNDDRFPPGQGYVYPLAPDGSEDRKGGPVLTGWGPSRSLSDGRTVPGLITPYVKDEKIFRGSPVKRKFLLKEYNDYPSARLGTMYNDLAATQRETDFTGVERTVLLADGEDMSENVGHAWLPNEGPYPAVFNQKGLCDPGNGATVRVAPTRLAGGANYGFVDGHVKWFKGTAAATPAQPAVYFPPLASADPVAPASEPKPGGSMTIGGKTYGATFRIR